jgi:Tol biopolymer transport system component
MVLAQNNDLYAELTWSPDSSVIYVSTGTLDSQIYAVSIVDGSMVPTTDDVSLKGGSDWSSDGQYFAYLTGSGMSNLAVRGDNLERDLNLYYMPDDGDVFAWNPDVPNNKKRLAWIEEFAWSPDGKSIALKWKDHSTFEENLCVIEFANPSNRQCLFTLEGSGMDDIQWSPDGLYLSFSAQLEPNIGTIGLFIIDTISGETSVLTEGSPPVMFTDFYWVD